MKNFSKYILSVLLLFVAMETIAADVVFNSNTTLTTNVEYDNVTINAGVTLTVNAGTTLIVKGNLVVSGTLTNNGTVNVSKNMSTESADSRVSGGTLCLNGDGKQVVNVVKKLVYDEVKIPYVGIVLSRHDDVTATTFSVNRLIIDNRSDYDNGNDGVHIEGDGVLMTNALEMQNGIVYTKTVSTKERAGTVSLDDFVTLDRANLRVTGTINSLQSANVMSFVDGPLTVTIAGRNSVRCPIGDDGASGYCELRNDESSTRHYQLSYINGFPQGGSGNEYILKGYWLIGHPDLDTGTGDRDPKVSNFKLRLGVYHESLMQLYYRQESTGEWVAQDAAQFNQDVFLGNYAGLSTSKNAPQIPGGTQFAIGVKSNITSECSGYETVNYVLSTEYEDGNSYVWTGAQGNKSWNSPYNWLGGEVPTGNSDVIIKTKYKTPKITLVTNNGCEFTTMVSGGEEMSVDIYPTISNKFAKVNSLSISGGDDSNKSMLTLYDGSVTLYVNHSFYVSDKCRINCRQAAGTEYGNLYVGGSLELDEDVRLTSSNARIEKNLKCHYLNVRGNRYEFVGNENSTIEFIGDENRSGYIFDLILNKSSDDLTLTVTSQNLYIGHQTAYNGSLTLIHGVLKCPNVCMNGNSTVTAENENSYVIGSFKRSAANLNGNVIFPIGNEKRSAYLRMNILDNSSNADITVSFKNQKYTVAGGTGLYESLGDEYWSVNTVGKRVTADVLLKYDPAISNVDFANGKNIVAANLETAKNWIQVASEESSFGANYREMKNLAFQTDPVFAFAAAPSVTEAIWLGRVDDDWFNIHNWKYFAAPNASRDTYVGINGTEGSSIALLVYPNINKNKTAEVNDLNIGTPESTGVTVTNGGLSIGHDLNIKSGDLIINRVTTMAVTNLANIGDSESPKATLTNSGIATFGQNMVIDGDVINAGTMSLNGGVDYVKSNGSFVNNGSAVIRGVLEVQGGSIENNAALAADKYMSMASGSTFSGSGDTSFGTLSGNAIINSGGIVNVSGIISVAADIETNSGGEFNVATLNMAGTGRCSYNHVGGTSHIGTLNINNGGSGLNIQYGNVEVDNLLMNNGVIELNSAINNNIWVKSNLDRGGDNAYIDGLLYRTLPSAANKTDITKQYLFPVGNNGVYSYAKIGPNKSGDVVGVQYFNVKPTQGSGSELYGNLSSEYWKVVTKSGEQAGNVYITLNYDNSDNFEPSLADYYSLAHYDGMRWTVYDRDEANNKAGIDAVNKLVYYKTGISVNNDGPTAHLFTLGYTKRVDRWTGSKSSAWSDDDNWSGGLVPSVMAFIPSLGAGAHNYPVIGTADNVGLTSVVVDGSQATLTINGGTLNTDALTVTDNTNPGHVIINQRHDQSSNLVVGSTNYSKFTVNRTLKTNILNYVGSATTEGTIENWVAADYLGLYNYETEKYTAASTGKFDDGIHGSTVGLFDANVTEKTLTQIGTIATGDVVMAAPRIDGNWYAWHMFSNPYQAALDLESAFATFDHVEPIMWFRSFDSGSYKYTTYSVTDGVQVSQASKPSESVTAIAPQQAFFVRTTSPYATPNVTFKSPTDATIVTAGTRLKAVKVVNDVLRLTVGSEIGLFDEAALLFRDGGSLESIQRDALKRMENGKYNQIYALKEGTTANAIAVYPRGSEIGEVVMPIGVQLASGATMGVIKATNIDEFSEADEVVLYDFVADMAVNLRDVDEYQFEAPAGMRINDRFAIGLKNLKSEEGEGEPEQGSATAIGNVINGVIMICQNDDRDAVVSVSADMLGNASMVNVYDMSGRLVKKQNIEQTKTVVALGDQKGVYIVEAICGDKSQKAKMRVF